MKRAMSVSVWARQEYGRYEFREGADQQLAAARMKALTVFGRTTYHPDVIDVPWKPIDQEAWGYV